MHQKDSVSIRLPFSLLSLQVSPVFLPLALFWQLSRYEVLQVQFILFNVSLLLSECWGCVGSSGQSVKVNLRPEAQDQGTPIQFNI